MKLRPLWLGMLALLFCGPLVSGEDFAQANQAYAEGKYAEARVSYERLLADGPRANVYYNLGNACFRLNEPGRAVLAYERALALQPSLADAAANLKFVREKSGSRVAEQEWLARGLLAIPLRWASSIACGLSWAGFILLGLVVWRRRGGAAVFFGGLLLVAGLAYGAGAWWAAGEQGRGAVVVVEKTDARSDPADRAGLAESLTTGSRVRVLEEQGAWTYCELPGGQHGWIKTEALERICPPRKS